MKSFVCVVGVVAACLAFTGCKSISLQQDGVTYSNSAYMVQTQIVKDANPNVTHLRATVTATDPSKIPGITGSVTDVPNGKQADIVIEKK